MMTLDILICTIGERINRVPQMLLPQRDNVNYIVSWQTDGVSFGQFSALTQAFSSRRDVKVFTLEGRGLSRNRNNAIDHSTADICLIADDDCLYTAEQIDRIMQVYQSNTIDDIICFMASTFDGQPLKHYPIASRSYAEALKEGYYPSSVEITFRRQRIDGLRFNEQFGLGSGRYAFGEEFIFMKDAADRRLNILFKNETIVRTEGSTTGGKFLTDPLYQQSKGAVFGYCYPRSQAVILCLKEAYHHMRHNKANPFTILKNMLYGVNHCNTRS